MLLSILQPEAPGVYKIINTFNGRVYVGQTKNLRDRCDGHLSSFRKGTNSRLMQQDFNLSGERCFWFEVLERLPEDVERSELLEREKHWILSLNPYYNLNANPLRAALEEDVFPLGLDRAGTFDPVEFCRKYSDVPPDQWGYKGKWNYFIAENLEVSVKTVEGWGDDFKECPERYKKLLWTKSKLSAAQELIERLGLK